MDLIDQVVAWFTDPANWSGTAGVPNRLVEHVLLSLAAIVTAIVIAVPVGLAIGHTGKGAFMTVSVANLGRSIPSYALLIIFVTWFGIGFAAAYPALFVLAIPPILTNTYVGLRQVDRDMVEAGRAIGDARRPAPASGRTAARGSGDHRRRSGSRPSRSSPPPRSRRWSAAGHWDATSSTGSPCAGRTCSSPARSWSPASHCSPSARSHSSSAGSARLARPGPNPERPGRDPRGIPNPQESGT